MVEHVHEPGPDERTDPGAGEDGVHGLVVDAPGAGVPQQQPRPGQEPERGEDAVRRDGERQALDAHERLVDDGGEHTRKLRRCVVVAVVALAALVVAGCGGDDSSPPEVAALDAERIDLGGAPWGIAVDGETVWVSDASRATLVALDSVTGDVRREVGTGAPDPRDAGIAVVDGRLWVANLGGSVGVLDAATGTPFGRVEVGPGEPAAVAVDERWAWAPRHGPGGGLTRIDSDLDGASPVALPDSGFALAIADGTVWVSGLDQGLFAVDAATSEVRLDIDLPGAPRGVAVAAGDVWVTLRDRQQVVRVDGDTGEVVARLDVDGQPWPVAAGAGSVWVATLEGQLIRIDPATTLITATAAVAAQARGVAVADDAVWVTSQTGVVTRVAVD